MRRWAERGKGILWMAGVVALTTATAWAGANGSLIQQKAGLLDRFLAKSDTSSRVSEKGDPKLQGMLDQARQLREQALAANQAGDGAKAVQLLDQAIKLAIEASRKSASPASREWYHRARYEDMLQSMPTLMEAYQRNAERPGAKSTVNLADVKRQLDQARGLAGGNIEEAARVMEGAKNTLVTGLKTMLDDQTLVYELKFATPADEYRYEVDRSHGYEALLRMALTSNPVGADDQGKIQAHVIDATNIRQQAAAQADGGDFSGAIKTMEKANDVMGKALRLAGINLF